MRSEKIVTAYLQTQIDRPPIMLMGFMEGFLASTGSLLLAQLDGPEPKVDHFVP